MTSASWLWTERVSLVADEKGSALETLRGRGEIAEGRPHLGPPARFFQKQRARLLQARRHTGEVMVERRQLIRLGGLTVAATIAAGGLSGALGEAARAEDGEGGSGQLVGL